MLAKRSANQLSLEVLVKVTDVSTHIALTGREERQQDTAGR